MRNYETTNRLFETVRSYSVPAACLFLWLGVCAAAWMSLGNQAPPAAGQPQIAVQARQQNGEPISPRPAQKAGNGNPAIEEPQRPNQKAAVAAANQGTPDAASASPNLGPEASAQPRQQSATEPANDDTQSQRNVAKAAADGPVGEKTEPVDQPTAKSDPPLSVPPQGQAATKPTTGEGNPQIRQGVTEATPDGKSGEKREVPENTTPKPDPSVSGSSQKQPAVKPATNEGETPTQPDLANTVTTPGSAAKERVQPPSETPANATASRHISRAQLASGIENREPLDHITEVFHSEGKALRRLYYFTEIKDLHGGTVTHNWWHEDRLMAEVSFRVGSNSWRAYSSKKLIPSMAGPWRVVATDDQGNTLSVERFVYKAP